MQHLYWSLAVCFCSLSILGLLRLLYEWRVNPAMRRRPVTYFYCMLAGDAMWVATYFPYHVRNLMLLSARGRVDVNEDAAYCRASFFMPVLSVCTLFVGLLLVSYYPYALSRNSDKGLMRQVSITTRQIVQALSVAFLAAVLWFTTALIENRLGSYRGLYWCVCVVGEESQVACIALRCVAVVERHLGLSLSERHHGLFLAPRADSMRVWCRVVSCRVVSCRVVSCRVVSCRVVSCRVVCRVGGAQKRKHGLGPA